MAAGKEVHYTPDFFFSVVVMAIVGISLANSVVVFVLVVIIELVTRGGDDGGFIGNKRDDGVVHVARGAREVIIWNGVGGRRGNVRLGPDIRRLVGRD